MKVWILQTGEPLHTDKGFPRPMRCMNIANYFIERGHKVIIWSSCFYHQEKKHRYLKFKSIEVNKNLTINLIPSPGYRKNIGLKRLWDHFILGCNLKNILKISNPEEPDFAFIGYPPIEISFVLANWLKNKKTKVVLDIKDQWPEYFIDNLPNYLKKIGKILFYPYFLIAKKTMRDVDGICSMSNSYLKWSKNFSKTLNKKFDYILPLTSPKLVLDEFEFKEAKRWLIKKGLKKDKKVICFVGSLSKAFDFVPIQKAINKLNKERDDFLLVICGEGDNSAFVKQIFKSSANVIFPGWIDIKTISVLFSMAHVSIAPYLSCKNFNYNIPNKIIDSIAHDLPFITSLRGEVEQLVKSNNVGLICDENYKSWYNAFSVILNDISLRKELSLNCHNLYEEKFQSTKNYITYIKKLEKFINLN